MSISQGFALYDHPSQMEPLLPADHRLGPLLERAHDLIRRSAHLAGRSPSGALPGLRRLLRAMNSYYSNKIEGQHTLPLQIEQALRNDYAQDADLARRQRLALAHMDTEAWLEQTWTGWNTADVWAPQTVAAIHRDLFTRLPGSDLPVEGAASADEPLRPGQWRTREVSVGRHAGPPAAHLPAFLARWAEVYGSVRRGEMQLVAMAAAHHRLAWIHPFPDGNGRVARLHSHAVLGQLGLTNGLWSPLRGFARAQEAYYAHLAAADAPRSGDLDGRGNLSEAGLVRWITWVLDQCLDQVGFMAGLPGV